MNSMLITVLTVTWFVQACTAFTKEPANYHIQTDDGGERFFKYQTLNGQFRKEKRLDDGTQVGTYGWVDPTGLLRLYDYVADDWGYRIINSYTENLSKGAPLYGSSSSEYAPSTAYAGNVVQMDVKSYKSHHKPSHGALMYGEKPSAVGYAPPPPTRYGAPVKTSDESSGEKHDHGHGHGHDHGLHHVPKAPESTYGVPPPKAKDTYVPPVKVSYSPPKQTYGPPPVVVVTETYTPPKASYSPPPKDTYLAPKQTYVPPSTSYSVPHHNDDDDKGKDSYSPPKQSYVPPVVKETYVPPKASYVPPKASYVPPKTSYVPPKASYVPPKASYVPPKASYVPPKDTYVAPKHSYSPPTVSYSVPSKDDDDHHHHHQPSTSYSVPVKAHHPVVTYEAPKAAQPSYHAPVTSYKAPTKAYHAPTPTYSSPVYSRPKSYVIVRRKPVYTKAVHVPYKAPVTYSKPVHTYSAPKSYVAVKSYVAPKAVYSPPVKVYSAPKAYHAPVKSYSAPVKSYSPPPKVTYYKPAKPAVVYVKSAPVHHHSYGSKGDDHHHHHHDDDHHAGASQYIPTYKVVSTVAPGGSYDSSRRVIGYEDPSASAHHHHKGHYSSKAHHQPPVYAHSHKDTLSYSVPLPKVVAHTHDDHSKGNDHHVHDDHCKGHHDDHSKGHHVHHHEEKGGFFSPAARPYKAASTTQAPHHHVTTSPGHHSRGSHPSSFLTPVKADDAKGRHSHNNDDDSSKGHIEIPVTSYRPTQRPSTQVPSFATPGIRHLGDDKHHLPTDQGGTYFIPLVSSSGSDDQKGHTSSPSNNGVSNTLEPPSQDAKTDYFEKFLGKQQSDDDSDFSKIITKFSPSRFESADKSVDAHFQADDHEHAEKSRAFIPPSFHSPSAFSHRRKRDVGVHKVHVHSHGHHGSSHNTFFPPRSGYETHHHKFSSSPKQLQLAYSPPIKPKKVIIYKKKVGYSGKSHPAAHSYRANKDHYLSQVTAKDPNVLLGVYDHNSDGNFKYNTGRQFHYEKVLPNGQREGKYGYVDPFGIFRQFHYATSPYDGGIHVQKDYRYVGKNYDTSYDRK